MRILFILDPLEKLDLEWDTSLALLRETAGRGHQTWVAGIPDIESRGPKPYAFCSLIEPRKFPKSSAPCFDLNQSVRKNQRLESFDLILIRKEPPFDEAYYYLTLVLESISSKVPMVNHPRGIRDTNEKLGILHFPKWIPETIVTCSPDIILTFHKRIRGSVVLKPLNEKGGKGIRLFKRTRDLKRGLLQMTHGGQKMIMAQSFLENKTPHGDKRILILNGKILTAYEKRPPKNDFRANLSLGGSFHPTEVSEREKRLVRDMKPYLLENGLCFVGIDVMEGKLLDLNVTCPAGLTEAKSLYPRLALVEAWADALESLRRAW